MEILDNSNSPMLNESNVSIWTTVKKWALISALVGVVFQLLQQVFGIMSQSGMVIAIYTILSLAVSIGIYVYALREHRDTELEGFMSFKRACPCWSVAF